MAKQRPFQAGDLDRKLDVQRQEIHINSKGERESSSYGPYLSGVPCKWEEMAGTEEPEADRETAFGKAEATIRYKPDITEVDRVFFEGKEYDIINVREGSVRRQLTILTLKKRN